MSARAFARRLRACMQAVSDAETLTASLCLLLHQCVEADVFWTDDEGGIRIGHRLPDGRKPGGDGGEGLVRRVYDAMRQTDDTAQTMQRDDMAIVCALWLPVYVNGLFDGALIVCRCVRDMDDNAFDGDEQTAAEWANIVLTMLRRQAHDSEAAACAKRAEVVRGAVNTLSYSELEAAVHVMDALPGSEGLLVTGRIADKLGMTRSVVVNALRKLESAGLVETRSLGMKGTHILVKNPALLAELNKLKR